MREKYANRGRMPPGHITAGWRETLRKILATAAGVVLFLALVYIGWLFLREWRADWELRDLSRFYTADPDELWEETMSSEDTGGDGTDSLLYREIDFAGLTSLNPDIIAWIYIPDTPIDYPVCRGEDDTWYLTHSYRGDKSASGAIFEYAQSASGDAVRYFFGHNMRTGIQFGSLKKYREDEYLAAHSFVYVYTPEANYRAVVFAAQEVSASGPAYETGREPGTEEYAAWIRENFPLRDSSPVKEITGEERLFILSTCTGSRSDRRYAVCAAVDEIRFVLSDSEPSG